MVWRVELGEGAKKDLAKLDKSVAKRVTGFIRGRLMRLDDPRSIGEVLKGPELGSFWKYLVGDYRVIASIEDARLLILVVRVGNRREVYKR